MSSSEILDKNKATSNIKSEIAPNKKRLFTQLSLSFHDVYDLI